jgi:hypothetical protein
MSYAGAAIDMSDIAMPLMLDDISTNLPTPSPPMSCYAALTLQVTLCRASILASGKTRPHFAGDDMPRDGRRGDAPASFRCRSTPMDEAFHCHSDTAAPLQLRR